MPAGWRAAVDTSPSVKANVLKSDVFFLDICIGVARENLVSFRECYIDSLCLDVLMHPERYDVIVTTNMFGDILSDVTGYLVGGLGSSAPLRRKTKKVRKYSVNP